MLLLTLHTERWLLLVGRRAVEVCLLRRHVKPIWLHDQVHFLDVHDNHVFVRLRLQGFRWLADELSAWVKESWFLESSEFVVLLSSYWQFETVTDHLWFVDDLETFALLLERNKSTLILSLEISLAAEGPGRPYLCLPLRHLHLRLVGLDQTTLNRQHRPEARLCVFLVSVWFDLVPRGTLLLRTLAFTRDLFSLIQIYLEGFVISS